MLKDFAFFFVFRITLYNINLIVFFSVIFNVLKGFTEKFIYTFEPVLTAFVRAQNRVDYIFNSGQIEVFYFFSPLISFAQSEATTSRMGSTDTGNQM